MGNALKADLDIFVIPVAGGELWDVTPGRDRVSSLPASRAQAIEARRREWCRRKAGLWHSRAFRLIRSPVSLQRLHDLPQTRQVFYQANKGHDQDESEIIDSMEFVARVLMHVPDLNKP